MELIRVDAVDPDPQAIGRAAEVVRAGGLVAFPTETVYGLGAHALDTRAVRRIFQAKGRPATSPLIVHVPDADEARALVLDWPPTAERLAARFWPGPLTLVLEKRAHVPDNVTAGLPTVGLRVPAHPVAIALLRAAAVPIAAPSANRFTGVSPTTARHVVKELGDAVDLILDAGPTTVGIESTVLDLTCEPPRLLRPGGVSLAALEAVVGRIDAAPREPAANGPHAAPGMTPRHYAPRARVELFDAADRDRVAGSIADVVATDGPRIGAVVFEHLDAPVHREIIMPAHPAGYAERLYAVLHALDDEHCDLILIERPPASPDWLAVRDRLRRSAAPPTSSPDAT